VISGGGLTGRDAELAELRRALGGVGKFAGVVIAGAAGVGKTRLARELIGRAATAGQPTNWVVGTASARPIPLGAFTTALSSEAMAAVAAPAPSVRRVIDSLVGQGAKGRCLIGVDDAHLLDGFSAHVVHHLAQTREARLVVTLRSGTNAPDAVTALWKDGLLARLDLDPLTEDATRAMVESVLGGPIDVRSAKRFFKLTGGNPLYLQQLIRDQVAAERFRRAAGLWIWDRDVAVSQSMSDLVGSQLDRLPSELARVVDTLSQCEPLDVDVLADVVGREHVEAADAMHLITVERSGRTLLARLAHPLFGELRRATVGELHLSKVRGVLARRLYETDDSDPQTTVRRALLVLQSDLAPNPGLYLDAARHAMRLLDLDLADRFAAAATALGSVEAVELQAINRFLAGRGAKAADLLRPLASRPGPARHRWAAVLAANLTWMLARPAEAAEVLTALADGPETDAERAERLAVEACVDAVLARCAQAEQKARVALQSEELSDLSAMLAAVALIMSCGALGKADEITPVARAALDRATSSHETSHMRFWFLGVYARACRLTGRITECLDAAAVLAELANDVPGLAYANLVFLFGSTELMRGDLESAGKLLREALAGVEDHAVTTGLRPACAFALTELYAKQGRPDAAAETLAQARRTVPPDFLFMQTALALATGWTLAAGGSLAEAIDTVLGEAKVARNRQQPTHEVACLQAALQWGVLDGLDDIVERTRELGDELKLPLAEAVAMHADSLRARSGERLLGASRAYEAVGDRATAADAAAQAAAAFTGAQHRGRAQFAASAAEQLARDCGGLCTPATRSASAPVPLTGRQREIAELVAASLTNKEIADKLVMSVRTVEGHLLRACQRLGVTKRHELAEIMRRGMGPTSRGGRAERREE
jgi:DNA-binding CsgD family transcriptional regulator/tetratricopeptide (TPR) repeat protein